MKGSTRTWGLVVMLLFVFAPPILADADIESDSEIFAFLLRRLCSGWKHFSFDHRSITNCIDVRLAFQFQRPGTLQPR